MKPDMSKLYTTLICALLSIAGTAQITYADFVGTWTGTFTRNFPTPAVNTTLTMTIDPSNTYTETSGHFMPALYPNTQTCNFDAPTNRFMMRYLSTVTQGQSSYTNIWYEVIQLTSDTLEMIFNSNDIANPDPFFGHLFLTRNSSTSIAELTSTTSQRKLLYATDVMGRRIDPNTPNTTVIRFYADGTTEKVFISNL